MENSQFAQRALVALRSEPRLGPTFKLDVIRIEPDGAAVLEGEVETVAQKRLALERVAAIPDLNGIVDRIRVRPAAVMSDDGIRDHLRRVLALEPAFEGLRIVEWNGENAVQVRDGARAGEIEFEVRDSVVTLNGRLASLASKRLAGVLAWWIPGSRDVINGIAVTPSEQDAPFSLKRLSAWHWRWILWWTPRRSGSAFVAGWCA